MRKANKQASKCLSKALQDGQLQGMHASCNGKLFGGEFGIANIEGFWPRSQPSPALVLERYSSAFVVCLG
jgi:hypothetical protein